MSLESHLYEWIEWFDEAMPDSTAENFVTKFEEESGEFLEEPSLEEAVDSIATLIGWAYFSGYTVSDVQGALRLKLQKNKGRTFERMPDGTYHHVKETP